MGALPHPCLSPFISNHLLRYLSTIDVREYMALMGVSFGGTIDDKLEGNPWLRDFPSHLSSLIFHLRSFFPVVR